MRRNWADVACVGLLPVALALRLHGLDWDRGLFFHPDERQMLMVVSRLAWPQDLGSLLTPLSSWNPRFFAYGSLPLYLLRTLSSLLSVWRAGWAFIDDFYILGRGVSALADTATVAATYGLARRVHGSRVGILAALFVTLTVLHIQLAHFFTADTLVTLWIVLTVAKAVDVARYGRRGDGTLLGVLMGAALATKMSALPLTAVVVAACFAHYCPMRENWGEVLQGCKEAWPQVRRPVAHALGAALVSFCLLEPYALLDAGRFVQGIAQEIAMSQGWADFPYTRQYIGSVPYLYQMRQILLFAMGLPLGALGLGGFVALTVRLARRPVRDEAVLMLWPALYAAQQGAAHAKFIRYMLPLMPFLCVAAAATWLRMWDAATTRLSQVRAKRARWALATTLAITVVSAVFFAGAFLNVYRQVHPWIAASEWLCQRLPEGSTVLTEHWDDPLPVRSAAGRGGCPTEYRFLRLDLYAPDDENKLNQLLDAIQVSDYIILSSQRLYVPISRLSERYPLSSRYYQQLFAERLGFALVAAPAVYPSWAGITLLDDPRVGLDLASPPILSEASRSKLTIRLGRADESFTVYDHPQPLIFAKVAELPRTELEALLAP